MTIKIFTLTLFLALLWSVRPAYSQCTTEAGTISAPAQPLCAGQALDISGAGDAVLDGDDVLLFVAYDGASPQTGVILATSVTGSFPYQGGFLANSPFSVAAVAGNDLGGQVDWTDPCLSVSPAHTVAYLAGPELEPMVPSTLTCVVPQVVLWVGGTIPPGSAYSWSGPNGFTSTLPINDVNAPGQYCVTVTDPDGCTDSECVEIAADTVAPVADAGPDMALSCVNTIVVLDGSGSSTGATIVYSWFVNNNAVAGGTAFPTVNAPGTYVLVVTNTQNGCTAVDTVVITQDVVPPLLDPGPAQVLTCLQPTVQLTATGGPQVVFQWSGPTIFPPPGPTVTVSQPGVYTVMATGLNGCTSTASVDVIGDTNVPVAVSSVPFAIDCDNPSVQLDASGSSTGALFQYTWTGPGITPATANLMNPVVSIPGTYTLTVLNTANGCFNVSTVEVDGVALTGLSATGATCWNAPDGALAVSGFEGGAPPFEFDWQGPGGQTFSGPQLNGVTGGDYYLTITDQTGCMLQYRLTVGQPEQLIISSTFSSLCDETIVSVAVTGGTPPYLYTWTGNAGSGPVAVFTVADLYSLTITDGNNCMALLEIPVDVFTLCGYISGRVVEDLLANCATDAGEPGLAGWIVKAETVGGVSFYGLTDSLGNYLMPAALGDYVLSAVPPAPVWVPCLGPVLVSVAVADDTVDAADLIIQKIALCPALTVTIGTAFMRRCFDTNYYHVTWCNTGTGAADSAYILVTLDPFIIPVSSSFPYADLGNGLLRFDLGQVDVGECGAFSLRVAVSCDAVLGQTHCTEAHIFPDTACVPANPLWSGASVDVHAACDGDSLRFIIKNVGIADMTQELEYIVIEDHVMLMPAVQPPLAAGDSMVVGLPANGHTWRVEVEQEPHHPGLSRPALSVEGCVNSGTFTTGLVNNFPLDDADPWIDLDCTENVASFDPNDKQGFPEGYGAGHYVRPGTELTYRIRFQNTGTDTAFTVVVRDTLAAWLDPATLRPGPASHPYSFGLSGPGYLTFTFENILMPDSNINEPASHGFVQFEVAPRAGAPLETLVENQASIYFDFNDPVATNTTFHRLGENFVTLVADPSRPGISITAYPNPFREATRLEVWGLSSREPLQMRVFDRFGRMVREMREPGPVILLRPEAWPAGLYFFTIDQKGERIGAGKLVWEGGY